MAAVTLLVSLLIATVSAGSGHVSMSPGPPQFVHPAHNVTVVEGQEVTLICSVANLQGYQLAWVHEESQSILSIGDQLYTRSPRLSLRSEPDTSALTLAPVLSHDRGFYMCQINTRPMTYTRSYLQVLVPPTLEEWTGSYVEAREGATVTLTCRARAFPPPLITWRRADNDPIFRSPRTVWVVESGELVFESVRREHSGAYTCRVENNATAPISRTTHLTVTYAPVLWLGRERVGGIKGKDVTLNCSSEANPPPHHYWTVRNSNITSNSKYRVREDRNGGRSAVLLTVRSLTPRDFTSYHCHAINPTGHARGSITLYEIRERVVTIPTPPTRPYTESVPYQRYNTPHPTSTARPTTTTTPDPDENSIKWQVNRGSGRSKFGPRGGYRRREGKNGTLGMGDKVVRGGRGRGGAGKVREWKYGVTLMAVLCVFLVV